MTKGLTREGFQNNDDDNSDNDSDNDTDDNDNDSDNDDIYIDCRPTGSDGKVLYEENLSLFKPSLNMGNFKRLEKTFSFVKKIEHSPVFFLLIGFLIAFIIVKFGHKAISKSRALMGLAKKKLAKKVVQKEMTKKKKSLKMRSFLKRSRSSDLT